MTIIKEDDLISIINNEIPRNQNQLTSMNNLIGVYPHYSPICCVL